MALPLLRALLIHWTTTAEDFAGPTPDSAIRVSLAALQPVKEYEEPMRTIQRKTGEKPAISPAQARSTALAALAADLPAAVLAHLLDININTALAWASYAQTDWTAYLTAAVEPRTAARAGRIDDHIKPTRQNRPEIVVSGPPCSSPG